LESIVFKHILCPVDGSVPSLVALDAAAQFAFEQRASLTICTVVDPAKAAAMAFGDPGMTGACYDAMDDEGTALAEEAAERVKNAVAAHAVTLHGSPVQSIVEYAAAGDFDLIVMGSHGRSGIPRAFLGSVTEGVLRGAGIPVLVNRYVPKAEAVA
jgi:nucleotide-binding universal stress UspA family protein